MNFNKKIWLLAVCLILCHGQVFAAPAKSKWLQLDADSKERIRSLIKTDVESRTGFSTTAEERVNTSAVEAERRKENSAYKAAIDAATSEYRRAKKRSDDLTAQFQTMAYDYEESKKNVDNIQASITNIDNQISRYRQDINNQQKSLSKSLKTTKLGEAIVAVIYTRGFMDSAHKLERRADQASAPLIAEHMGTYIQSFTKVINNVLASDFIRAVQEGTAKWDRKEPFRIALDKGSQGTTYLRIKRYELYPFQAPEKGGLKRRAGNLKAKTAIITSIGELNSFLSQNNLSPAKYNLSRVESMLRDTTIVNKQAKANQREQLISFRERLDYLEQKISGAQTDRESLVVILDQKEARLKKMKAELEVLELKKESAELAFQNAQSTLLEKKRVHESIIIKTSRVVVKRSETPAEASAEAVIEELRDVLNDARTQHYSSTTDVADGKLVSESDNQSITKAKIIAVRPLSFINEGDSIRVKIAFRVRTILDTKKQLANTRKNKTKPAVASAPRPKMSAAVPKPPRPKPKATSKRPTVKKSVQKQPRKKSPSLAAVKKQPVLPTPGLKSVRTGSVLNFNFELMKVSKSGENLSILVRAKNKSGGIRYLAFYDRTTGYERSAISGANLKKQQVHQVYLWQGEKRTAAYDAYRGVPVQPDGIVIVELIFKPAPHSRSMVPKLKLVANVATRSIIRTYSWYTKNLFLTNIRVP